MKLALEFGRSLATGEHAEEQDEKLIFFDLLGLIMVSTSQFEYTPGVNNLPEPTGGPD